MEDNHSCQMCNQKQMGGWGWYWEGCENWPSLDENVAGGFFFFCTSYIN